MKPPLIEGLSSQRVVTTTTRSAHQRQRAHAGRGPDARLTPPPSGTIGRRWHHRRGTTGTNAHKPPREPKQVALRKEHGRAPAHWKPTLSPCPQRTSGVPSLATVTREQRVSTYLQVQNHNSKYKNVHARGHRADALDTATSELGDPVTCPQNATHLC
ncbi:hypothetical protein QR98_0097110 [Sarcoptes scabiei]|uniref:Uncharacterized protein n=1 Tax=Sarcoptes scabiei TaxID=52283 RepID=A0A132AJN9_SARSC|nr:hypothetical protein QR98_0097110 [Sarcoptes scabiei]